MSYQPLAGETIPDSGKLFIITTRPGRMGNRLLLFAHFIAFAEEHGHRVRNFTFQTYAKLFEGTCQDIFCEYPVAKQRSFLNSVPGAPKVIAGTRMLYRGVSLVRTINDKFHLLGRRVITLRELPGQRVTLLEDPEVQSRIRPAKVIFADGWRLRAPDCLPKHAEKIRRYFQPVPKIEQDIRLLIERMRQNAQVIIGVHIRHTDYRRWRGGKYFFPASRYAEWMRELVGQFPGIKFPSWFAAMNPGTCRSSRTCPWF